jgi:hypothetical protein
MRIGALRVLGVCALVISACSHAVDAPEEHTADVSSAFGAGGCAETTNANLVQPTVTCVGSDSTSSFAVFGYTNPTLHSVTIPLGSSNALIAGGSAKGAQQSPPTLFDSTSQTNAFVVRYAGAAPAWTLNGTTATASSSAPACTATVNPTTGVETVSLGTSGSGATVGVAGLDPTTLLGGSILQTQTPVTQGLHILGAPGTQAIGSLQGSMHVGNDAVPEYDIPLWVSPGRQGVQPDLSLTYAGSGNGIVGVGWVLRGLSTVATCTQTYSTGLNAATPDPDGALCLDGSPMVKIGANEWRVEQDPSTRVRATRLSSQIYTLTVDRSSGISSTYAAFGHSSKPNRWFVSSSYDRFGNALSYQYEYAPTRTGWIGGDEPRIHQINYTLDALLNSSRSVTFNYDDSGAWGLSGPGTRPDLDYQMIAGVAFPKTSLLTSIVASGPAPISQGVLRTYKLAYSPSSLNGRLLLKTLTECAGDGACRAPMQFGYSVGNGGFTEAKNTDGTPWTIPINAIPPMPGGAGAGSEGSVQTLTGDFNGDGLDDVFYFGTDGYWHLRLSSAAAPPGGNAPLTIATYRYGGGGDSASATALSPSAAVAGPGILGTTTSTTSGRYAAPYPSVVDLDRDGRMEIVFPTIAQTTTGHFVVHHQIYGIRSGVLTALGAPIDVTDNPNPIVFVDLDGDGVPGIIVPVNTSPSTTGTPQIGWQAFEGGTPGLWGSAFLASASLYTPFGSAGTLTSAATSPLTFQPKSTGQASATTGATSAMIDWTGTGNPMPLTISPPVPTSASVDVGAAAGLVFDYLETGRPNVIYPFGRQYLATNTALPDTDLPNFIAANTWTAAAGNIATFVPTPSQWNIPVLAANTIAYQPTSTFPSVTDPFLSSMMFAAARTLDANGDGLTDLLLPVHVNYEVPSSTDVASLGYRLYTRNGPRADMLTSITDAMGDQTQILYQTQTNGGTSDSSLCQFPISCATFGMQGVARVTYHAQLSLSRAFSFAFSQPALDVRGRGFLGFRKQVVTDLQTNTTTETDYADTTIQIVDANLARTTYPYARVPTAITTTTPLTSTVRAKAITFAGLQYFAPDEISSGRVLPTSIQTVESEGASSSSLSTLTNTSVTQTYDGRLNPAIRTTTYNLSGDQDVVTQTWSSDLTNWWLSIPVSVSSTSTVNTKASDGFVAPAAPTRTVTYTPDAHGLIATEVLQANEGNSQTWLQTAYTRDVQGHVTSVTRTDKSGDVATSTVAFDTIDGTFPISTTDPDGRTSYSLTHPGLGIPIASMNVDGVLSRQQYDGFGMLRHVSAPQCTSGDCSSPTSADATISYVAPTVTGAVYTATTVEAAGATSSASYDTLGRVVQETSNLETRNITYDNIFVDRTATITVPHSWAALSR